MFYSDEKGGKFRNVMSHLFIYSTSTCQLCGQGSSKLHTPYPDCQTTIHQEAQGTNSSEKCKASETSGCKLPCSFDSPRCSFNPSSTLCFLCSDLTRPPHPKPFQRHLRSTRLKTSPTFPATSGSPPPPSSVTPGLPLRTLSSECGIQVKVVLSPSPTMSGPPCPRKITLHDLASKPLFL